MAHAIFVMNGLVFMPTMQNATVIGDILHRRTLGRYRQQIFMQIAAERAPDRVVMVDPDLALFGCVALQTQDRGTRS